MFSDQEFNRAFKFADRRASALANKLQAVIEKALRDLPEQVAGDTVVEVAIRELRVSDGRAYQTLKDAVLNTQLLNDPIDPVDPDDPGGEPIPERPSGHLRLVSSDTFK